MAGHYTAREGKAVLSYARAVAVFLGLPRWDIALAPDPCNKAHDAEVAYVEERNLATIRLSREWATLSEKHRRNTITHEVLHLAHTRVSVGVTQDAKPLMHKDAHTLWSTVMDRELELMVDLLAGCLAETTELRRAWREAYR